MRYFASKKINWLLVIVLMINIICFGFGSEKVFADFWSEHKGSVLTVVKGLVMLLIINFMTKNNSGNGDEDFITSTIKNSLNANSNHEQEVEIAPGEVITAESINDNFEKEAEKEMINLINYSREERGLNPLDVDEKLVRAAREKAEDMVKNNYFEHQSPTHGSPFDLLEKRGIEFLLAGENLAYAHSASEAFELLMDSEEHRDNILKARYDKVGVGVIRGGKNQLFIVQLFIDSPSFFE